MDSERFNTEQRLKRRFFAMRNGIVADTLRKAGIPHRIIFGLNLPQISEIAKEFGPDAGLARAMWKNVSTRESQLIAPMLMPVGAIGYDEAIQWLVSAPSVEVVDVLCHRLLRRLDFAPRIAADIQNAGSKLGAYSALRLWFNLLPSCRSEARRSAEQALTGPDRLAAGLAVRLIDELDFLAEE